VTARTCADFLIVLLLSAETMNRGKSLKSMVFTKNARPSMAMLQSGRLAVRFLISLHWQPLSMARYSAYTEASAQRSEH
jgi:hypothetical protein